MGRWLLPRLSLHTAKGCITSSIRHCWRTVQYIHLNKIILSRPQLIFCFLAEFILKENDTVSVKEVTEQLEGEEVANVLSKDGLMT